MTWLGLDIGGANLKAADGYGWAASRPFALWRDPAGLASTLATLIREAPAAERLAVTMTGELCDCFRTKAQGVRHILHAVGQAADGREIVVYSVDGSFLPLHAAREAPQLVAASNWHALARFAGRYAEGRAALLIDIGSTTTDIVPLVDGRPATASQCDTERLLAGELLYMGIGRTPICAVVRTLPWRGRSCPVTAELFATTADAYVLLGDRPEDLDATATADGRPLTSEFAHERMARMICADRSMFSIGDAIEAAQWVRAAQLEPLEAAVGKVMSAMSPPPDELLLSGAGEFLAGSPTIVSKFRRVVSLQTVLGADVSQASTAHAAAALAMEAEL